MHRFFYPANLRADKSGGYVVTFKDMPEAITQGESAADALREAADCLEEAIANRIATERAIPMASLASKGVRLVRVPAAMAGKAALYLAMREAKITKTELARRLGCDEKEIRRLLDPRHASRLPRIEKALAALGKQIVIEVRAA